MKITGHHLDAIAVYTACTGEVPTNLDDLPECHLARQFRRHDRQLARAQYERTYKLDGKVVAKNRKPRFEQPKGVPALSEAGLTKAEVSRLTVRASYRSYKDPSRILPGASHLVNGKICTMTGQQHYGEYLLFKHDIVDEDGKAVAVKAKDCKFLASNRGLVFVS